MKPRRFLVAFAAAYLLSYLFRSVNAVISPELARDLALGPGSLGLVTSAYFVAFALVQIPAGMLLDRYGPRRVEPALLILGSTGALLFALAEGLTGLVVARAMIGAGVAVCLMAPLKAIATWSPRERQASLSAWIMTAGGIGALAATTPTEFALRFVHWRILFVGLALLTLFVAAWIWWRVPDMPKTGRAQGLRAQWSGVMSIFAHPRFWWLAPLGACAMGTFFAIQGLWSVPWMIEVNGFDRATAARHLLLMGVIMLAGYAALGMFSTRLARIGLQPGHLFAGGFALGALALAAILLELPEAWLWWSLYGLGTATNILAFPVLNEGFAVGLTGRANTALNLMMFGGSFVMQWGMGLAVDAARDMLGLNTAGGLRLAFATALALYGIAYAWFAWGWRRHAGGARLAVAGSSRGPDGQ